MLEFSGLLLTENYTQIKKLFFLPKSVKIQFFKTFILPHFDYCFSLLFYFSKKAIQPLSNCYYLCLYKLFNFSFKVKFSSDFITVNNELMQYKLSVFLHRFIHKIFTYAHKILHEPNAPIELKNKLLTINKVSDKHHKLRNSNNIYKPGSDKLNNYGDLIFYNFSKYH